jgi:CO dehydrogenase/acetyl-CoA synthase beta subunit
MPCSTSMLGNRLIFEKNKIKIKKLLIKEKKKKQN